MLGNSWERVREDTAIDNPEYQLLLEVFQRSTDQIVFIHLYVKTDWTRALLQRFKREWELLRQHISCPLFACPDTDDAKWEKFISLFGFKFLTDADFPDGSRRRIFWHQGITNGQVVSKHEQQPKSI